MANIRQADLVDVHAHFLTDDYVAAARASGHEQPDGMAAWPTWNLDQQLADMDRRGIRKAILSISSPGVHFDETAAAELARTVNDQAAAFVRSHPDRLGFFASLPVPDVDAAVAEVRRALDTKGAAGVVLESNARGRYLGDPVFEPLWPEIESRGGVVLVHPTSPPGWEKTALGRPRPMVEFMFDNTRTIVDLGFAGVLTRYPGLKIIVPHSGATLPILSDRIGLFQRSVTGAAAEPWADVMRKLWFDTAGTPFPTCIPTLATLVGTDRVVYGSDTCWTPDAAVDATLDGIDAADPPAGASSWRQLTTDNAERLFDRSR